MNKVMIIGLLFVTTFFMASSAFAANFDSATGEITIGGSNATPTKIIGLSKGVIVRYENPGTAAPSAQWYTVSSVHSGGNEGYATAQNLTNIMKQAFPTGSTAAEIATFLQSMPDAEASVANWIGWSTQ
ncbi:MAG: hypothetical protein P1P74_01335 [Desulfuromonadales bacterium]|nr:hypothetical protein [Desulfuromonadales bacterium]